MRKLGLSTHAWAILGVLLSYANAQRESYPAVRTMARESGMSPRKAMGIIRELEGRGIIRTIKRNRALTRYQFQPQICWNLCPPVAQIGQKSVSPGSTENPKSVSPGSTEVYTSSFERPTVNRWNDGKAIESDVWEWLVSLPFLGKASFDVRSVPVDVRNSSLAKQLMHNAWNRNTWFVQACKDISEWYSWPWLGDRNDKRKSSIRALIRDFEEQANLARWHIEQRGQFKVVQPPEIA